MLSEDIDRRLRQARRRAIFDPDELSVVQISRSVIERLLPHRGTMLLIDQIDRCAQNFERLVARRRVNLEDPVLAGHFPGDPVYPGALQLEAIGQAGLCLQALSELRTVDVPSGARAGRVRLTRVLGAQFTGVVRPGDELTLLSERVEDNGYTVIVFGQVLVSGRPVSAGACEAMIVTEGSE